MRAFIAALALLFGSAAGGAEFRLTSPDIEPGKPLSKAQEYDRIGCQGKNISPALEWHGAPKGTKSYAVTMYDLDAPTGSGWWHWIIVDIPRDASGLARNAGNVDARAAPAGSKQRRNDYGTVGYGGACPPAGTAAHHYLIKVYALDVEHLDLSPDSSAALVDNMLNQHALAKAEIRTTYGR